MKNKYFNFLLGIFGLFLVVFLASASERSMEDLASSATHYSYDFTHDTITNSEADTLTIPVLLLSQWTAHWTFYVKELSGTGSVKFVVEENDYSSGTARAWTPVDSVTINAFWEADSLGYARLTTGTVNGVRQRVRAVGGGTQSSKYDIRTIFKKP